MGLITTLFITTSMQLGLPDGLLSSLCYVESNHKIEAIAYNDGDTHSYGMCMIKLATAKQMGFKGTEKQLMEPKNNVLYAGKFLAYQIKRYNGNVARAVTAYNKGHSNGDGNSIYYMKVTKQWRNIAWTTKN